MIFFAAIVYMSVPATLIAALLGIWSGDGRWETTALVTGIVGFLSFMVVGLIHEDDA